MQDVIAITNRRLCDRPFLEQIERVCKLYPAAVILREKDLSDAEYAALAADVYSVCKRYNVRLILHTYVAVAEKTGINAIHLSIDNLRKYHSQLKDSNVAIKGCSIHSVQEAVEAAELGASYIMAGHIYSTDCKRGVPPRGLEFLKAVCENVNIPVYAIGGINIDGGRRQEVQECGAKGSCIMSGMMKA